MMRKLQKTLILQGKLGFLLCKNNKTLNFRRKIHGKNNY